MTRRTELDDRFPEHVICAWLGHSEKVARDHYQQVTVDHWDRASKVVSTQFSITDKQEGTTGAQSGVTDWAECKKTKENVGSVAIGESEKHPREDSNL